jgi:hypothetical protein
MDYEAILIEKVGSKTTLLYRKFQASNDEYALNWGNVFRLEAERGATRDLLSIKQGKRVVFNG